jgi:amino acid transporter
MPYAAAWDRLFPMVFGKLTRTGAPAACIVISSILLTLAIIPSYNSSTTQRFTDFVFLATTTTLIAYLYGVAAQKVRPVRPADRRPARRRRTRRPDRPGHPGVVSDLGRLEGSAVGPSPAQPTRS